MSKFKDYTDGIDAYEYCLLGGMRSGGKTLMQKGLLYNKLSEELGCPLEVVIKSLLEGGIIDSDGYGVQLNGLAINGDGSLSLTAVNGDHYDLKDYGKTWWLKGEKNE